MDGLSKEKIFKERKIWYSHKFVLFNILECLKDKELCFLSDKSVREEHKNAHLLKAHALIFLEKHFEWINFWGYKINIYHSVAELDFIPKFSYNPKKRTKEEEYIKYKDEFLNHVTGYSFFVDFDGKSETYYEEAKEFKKILDEYKLPYYCLNSSSKGFHFCIESKWLPDKPITKIISEIGNKIIPHIIAIYEFKSIDDGIYDIKRVKKCPYSYVCDGTIALPLSDEQFDNFNVDMVLMKNVLKNVKLFKRGLLVRNWGLTEIELKNNVKKFFQEHIE